MISEEDLAQGNAPDESKQRVRQITKAIRYKARKEGGNLFKAFNDYMSSASGVTATDRASVKQSLGLSERYSSWRDEIREIADIPSSEPKKDTEMSKEIKEKKVSNKIVINPAMKEAFDEIGAEVLDVYELTEEDIASIEVEEQEMTPEQKKQIQKQLQTKAQMMKKQQMLDRQRLQAQKSGKLPVGHAYEGYAPGDIDQKVGAVTAIPKKDRDAARDRLLAKAKAKREKMKMKEETEDSLRDKRMERGGVDGNVDYRRPPKPANTAGKKKKYDGMSALDFVKADIRKKHGKGAIMDTKKK